MHEKNYHKDFVLEKIIQETAEELGISIDMIWRVFTHYYRKVFQFMTEVPMMHMNTEFKVSNSRNFILPGFGRLVSKFGKTFKTKGLKEEFHLKRIENDKTQENI